MILNNGINIPDTGFGTWQIEYGKGCEEAVTKAIELGYRHIDTAGAYGNEKSVGLGIKEAVRKGFIKDRSDIFLTSKLWNTNRGYNKAFKAFEKSMKNLDSDYIDLYLIHWPANSRRYKEPAKVNRETWKALEEIYKTGRVKAIGVSNFLPHHIEEMKETAKILPVVNQIETHIGYLQEEVVKYNTDNGIITEAYSPLGTGALLKNETISGIAAKYNVTTAIVCLSFLWQKGLVVLPKTIFPERMKENLERISLDEEDMELLENMPYIGGHAHNPDEVEF